MKNFFILVCITLLLCACGSGGGTPSEFTQNVPQIQFSNLSTVVNFSSKTISGTVSQGSTVYVTTDTTASDDFAEVRSSTWSYTITGLVEGPNKILVTAQAPDGRSSSVSSTIQLDTTPPNVSVSPIPSPAYGNNLSIFGTAEPGALISANVGSQTLKANVIDGKWQIPLPPLNLGINSVSIVAQDAAHNQTTLSKSFLKGSIELIAHRGASFAAPENTIPAFELAFAQGADAIECDVHLSKDGKIMVIHDFSTGRTAGVDLVISETESTILRSLDVGIGKDIKFRGERIPFLEEILDLLPPNKRIWIEIKTGSEILPYLIKAISNSNKQSQIVITSFDYKVLSAVEKYMPALQTYLDTALDLDLHTLNTNVKSNAIDGINIFYPLLNKTLIENCIELSLNIAVWTVNDMRSLDAVYMNSINGIISDKPDNVRKSIPNNL